MRLYVTARYTEFYVINLSLFVRVRCLSIIAAVMLSHRTSVMS